MRVSVIIPTYNRRDLLKQTLHYLSQQQQQEFFDIEVIIVDDGSTDGTYELINDYKTEINSLIYINHSRNLESFHLAKARNPACIRNIGVRRSSGDILIFLDCGVLIPPHFAEHVVERYLAAPGQVLVHYTVGLFTSLSDYNQYMLTNLSPNTLFQEVQQLAQHSEWIDHREGLFNMVDDQLDLLPAPWTLTWTCALSIPKFLFEKVGGFDESFQGWGGEDTDLGYRLYQSGASFVATRDCIALHLPHEKLQKEERLVTDKINRKKLHKKGYTLATELYCYYPGPYYNQVLSYYNNLVLMNLIPNYASETLNNISSCLLNNTKPSLLIGTDCKFVANFLSTTHNFVHNLSTFNKFNQWFPNREIQYLLGCDTPYKYKYFKTVILTDFIRLIPKILLLDLFKEVYRIGQSIFCLYTRAYISPAHKIDENQWLSLDEMQHLLKPLHLQLVFASEINNISVFKMQMQEEQEN